MRVYSHSFASLSVSASVNLSVLWVVWNISLNGQSKHPPQGNRFDDFMVKRLCKLFHSCFCCPFRKSGNARARAHRASFEVCVLSTNWFRFPDAAAAAAAASEAVTFLWANVWLSHTHTHAHTHTLCVLIWQFFKCWHWPTYRLSTPRRRLHLQLIYRLATPIHSDSSVKCGQ